MGDNTDNIETVGDTLRETIQALDMTSEDLGFEDDEFDKRLEAKEESEQTDFKDQDGSETAEPSADAPTEDAETEEILAAPNSWTAEEKEAFNSFPAEAKKALIRRQKDMDRYITQRSQEVAEREKQIEEIERYIAPHREDMARQGVTPQVLEQFYQWHKYLSNPETAANGIQELAKRYGVNPRVLNVSNNNAASQPQEDSRITELQQRIEQQQQQLAERERREYEQGVAAEVSAFRSETDENGKSRFPLINPGEALEQPLIEEFKMISQVNPEMPLRDKLETAYKRALALNPHAAEAINSSRASTAAKVQKAKTLGASVTGSASTFEEAPQTNMSLREQLAANWKNLAG